jgi:hypothetical protein
MSKYLIKISYKDEGYSVWKNEGDPIPLYADEQSALQQACAIYCQEVDFNTLDASIANKIKNFIATGNYHQAVLEMNFSDKMKFVILKTMDKNPDQILINKQLILNFNQNNIAAGAICRKCNHHNQYASSDSNDGKYICYACKPYN